MHSRGYVSKSNLSGWSFVQYLMLFVRNPRAYQTMPESTPNALVWTRHHPWSPSLRDLLISSLNSANIPSWMQRVNLPTFFLTFPYYAIIPINWFLRFFAWRSTSVIQIRNYLRSVDTIVQRTDRPILPFSLSISLSRFHGSSSLLITLPNCIPYEESCITSVGQ